MSEAREILNMPDDMSMETKVALLQQQVDLLKTQNAMICARMDSMQQTLTSIDRTVSQAEGGWKVLLFLGTLMGGLTGIIGFFAGKTTGAS